MNSAFRQLSPAGQEFVRRYAARRGVLDADIAGYLEPKLDLSNVRLPNTDLAIARLDQARRGSEDILILGDYDCDGISATAALQKFLIECGRLHPRWQLPNRQTDRYGLDIEKAERILAAKRPDLLIVLDSGTNAGEAVRFLRQNRVDTVIIDHHPADQDLTTKPAVVLNPKLDPALGEETSELCTAGLVLLFCNSLAEAWQCQAQWDRELAIALGGLGTLGDVCALTPLNRAIVKRALDVLNNPKVVGRWRGIQALLCERTLCRVNQRSLQFELIPKLNALGRLAAPDPGVELLLSDDDAVARELAARATGINALRQQLQERTVESANAQTEAILRQSPEIRLPILANQSWHHGVVGPAASRIVERYQRSALLLGGDGPGTWRGSGRAWLHDDLGALRGLKTSGLLTRGGGHAAAVGVAMDSAQINRLRQIVPGLSLPQVADPGPAHEVIGEVDELPMAEWQLVFECLEPFGRKNPAPLFTANNCLIKTAPVPLRLKDGTVWAVRAEVLTQKGHPVSVGWRDPVKAAQEWGPGRRCDLQLELSWKEYNGRLFHNWMVVACGLDSETGCRACGAGLEHPSHETYPEAEGVSSKEGPGGQWAGRLRLPFPARRVRRGQVQ